MPEFAIAALNEHRRRMLAEGQATGPVFCDTLGGRLRPQNLMRRSFHPLIGAAGVPRIRFHDLRHCAATMLLLQAVHPKTEPELLGHASIEVTLNTYGHVLPTMQRAAADQLDRLFG